MEDGRNESVLVAGLYTEWLSNIMAYRHQLDEMDNTLLITDSIQVGSAALKLQEDIATMKAKLDALLDRIENAQFDLYQTDSDTIQISLAEMLVRRQLRDEIRKAEQTIFLIRYSIGQLIKKVS